ncbi:glycine-rich domain-containing protein [Sphingopyxis sp.]|uniref:glycine-rich domain-containing protein n=1 Tax=Sphingopyxis sp. TaxID=1908224 RepID=UPI003D0A0BD2
MTAADQPLWEALSDYRVGPDDAPFSFEARLARENRWGAEQAARVMHEYRRFLFLAIVAGHPVTPSDAVDQAWHLHLTYSRDYWDRLCGKVLGQPFHHGPTAGGDQELHRYFAQYADTLASYERWFGAPPPADIWPSAHRRLLVDPRAVRVGLADHIVVSKHALRLGALATAVIALTLAGLWLGIGR